MAIRAIKRVRELTGKDLKDSKGFVDAPAACLRRGGGGTVDGVSNT
ncbi:MAG: hypothetical protein HY597_06175 [Candidatus Omnitrophica bacterium]|nr:hypothetical protein [Candidatus Omnitrophota bacterium]